MIKVNPLLLTDFYKTNHYRQYPKGTQFVYSNLTPRKSRYDDIPFMVFFGLQYFILEYLMERFNVDFFFRNRELVLKEYKRRLETSVGGLPDYGHIEALHKLGYLPVLIKALPEGSKVPMRVPCLTITNTNVDFYWVTNFLETIMSATLWQPCTSATLAYEYRRRLNRHAADTGMPAEFVQWQGHDFSFRGMSSLESAVLSGAGHLLSFTGTDTIPAIDFCEQYYQADATKELVGGSVAATEHSVMCSGGEGDERETFRRLIQEVYPNGILSVVSDTWNLWKVLTDYVPSLKAEIMARDGKLVIRPDSGNPVKIICGDPEATNLSERKGVVELLWDTFGGTTTKTGHRLLDSHVGAIYGDSITLARADAISEQLKLKGFASQEVLGIGSYTYQYNTRDTFGLAMKATHVIINGKPMDIFKTPITDDGTKNSATGLLRVDKKNGTFVLKERCDLMDEAGGALQPVFLNGELLQRTTLAEVRKTLWPDPEPHNPVLDFSGDLSSLSE